jgi:hypothetical protein
MCRGKTFLAREIAKVPKIAGGECDSRTASMNSHYVAR